MLLGVTKSVPYTFPNGDKIELYYIGTLAAQLGRQSDTLRKWEISGILPETCFKDAQGARLYSEEQINAIVRAAEKAHIGQGKPIKNTTFPANVAKSMSILHDKYCEMLETKGVENNEEDSKEDE